MTIALRELRVGEQFRAHPYPHLFRIVEIDCTHYICSVDGKEKSLAKFPFYMEVTSVKTDEQMVSEMDIGWLTENGWTVAGNLAYRRILEAFNETGVLQLERIEQILMRYECDDSQIAKIKQALAELVALRRELFELSGEENADE